VIEKGKFKKMLRCSHLREHFIFNRGASSLRSEIGGDHGMDRGEGKKRLGEGGSEVAERFTTLETCAKVGGKKNRVGWKGT